MVIKICEIEEPLPEDAPLTPLSMTDQVNVVPATSELRAMEVLSPLQIVWLEGVAMALGIGFTVTITVMGDPMQPFSEGVMV